MDEDVIQQRKSGGFTLVEVITAAALLVVAILPIMNGMVNINRHNLATNRKTICLYLAQTEIEKVKAILRTDFTHSVSVNNRTNDEGFLCSIECVDLDEYLRKVTVGIGYDNNNNHNLDESEISIRLSTLITRRY